MNSIAGITPKDLEKVQGIPLLLNVDTEGSKVIDWIKENRDHIEHLIKSNGALLIRGLKILSSKQFGQVLTALFDAELLTYTYRSTPRTELRGNVYTATEYHSDQLIHQHNENAYSNSWAMRIGFLCMLPPETGGETPIGDSRVIYQKLPDEIREKFEQKGIMYVRNYSDIDLPWSEVFQTDDKAVVEQYCKDNRLEFEWKDDNGLRTRQINKATLVHPDTGEKVWFNQAHLFHVSSLDKEIYENLMEVMTEEDLPRNTYYGDGTAIEMETVKIISDLYEQTKIMFPWQMHDVMLLDNMLFTHGRMPFTGNRKVLVGMARPYGCDDL